MIIELNRGQRINLKSVVIFQQLNKEKEASQMEPTLNQIIEEKIIPHVEYLFSKISAEKDNITIDGVKAFNKVDMFVPGKVANVCSYLLVNTAKDSPKYPKLLSDFKEIVDFTVKYELKTWGIFFYLTCLERLDKHGLLHEVVSPQNLQDLKAKLDWRKFINEHDLSLIDLPTNYYGCGFGVARLRELLGWENGASSQKLFDKLMAHVDAYSGALGFSDETPGEGRFDRYSVLLPGEICARLVDTGMEVPAKLKMMLRKSCDIHLQLANENGNGFAYGRTIGTYGDTSVLEVLSIAAYLNILSAEEKELAYAYCVRISEKFTSFWLDQEMQSVNLWEKGRKADSYMNKNRILGENLSLCFQHIHTCELWNKAGFKAKIPLADYEKALAKLPRHYFVKFAEGEYDRALAIIRDKKHVFSLPLVSGGNYQYQHAPYFPIPNDLLMLANSPGEKNPNLIVRFTLNDGSVIMPLAYLKHIETREDHEKYIVNYKQDELCLMGDRLPCQDRRLQSITTYTFTPGVITREDTFFPTATLEAKEIYLEFGTFSEAPVQDGNQVRFGKGDLYEIELYGLAKCTVEKVDGNEAYKTPHGSLKYKVSWQSEAVTMDKPFFLKWVLKYQ